jgi:hypothetical protein
MLRHGAQLSLQFVTSSSHGKAKVAIEAHTDVLAIKIQATNLWNL